MRNLKVLLLAVGLIFSVSPAATAHAELVKSFPVANAKLTKSPKFVQIEFAESIVTLKSKSANSIVILDSKATASFFVGKSLKPLSPSDFFQLACHLVLFVPCLFLTVILFLLF
jgi:hypothetical protein